MKVNLTNLAPLFNEEIRRVAREENRTDPKSMDAFMKELAAICGLKQARMIYHWRAGTKYRLPADHVPALCKRFRSNVLLDALKSADVAIEVPGDFDLALQANHALRQELQFHERILRHFADGRITPGELLELKELEARAHQHLHIMIGYAEVDCARGSSAADDEGVAFQRKDYVRAKRGAVDSETENRKRAAR